MRVLVFFDLPVKTKKERKIYRRFRKFLIKNGHHMLQFSVYSKILANRDAASHHVDLIRKHAPEKGNIRIMTVTEKQYASIKIIVGGKTYQEEIVTEQPFIHF
jgi:CRISPR-associated protein Cas2